VQCGIYTLPIEYDVVSEVEEIEDNDNLEDMARHMPMCYYVTQDGCARDQQAMFESLATL